MNNNYTESVLMNCGVNLYDLPHQLDDQDLDMAINAAYEFCDENYDDVYQTTDEKLAAYIHYLSDVLDRTMNHLENLYIQNCELTEEK